ncbi:hypothetical protein [Candidatus Aalborgicola defluviihabitans]|uniref:hypothetical protein n=1 Tax=Candidatus Aalborgicola defluviihabitans TaxID=3386187 RepID=UPI001EC98155|nr:hypothetical protein [Burkholderiales bacterium]MBK7282643.1 hypothetical protein [Burkholderiales bacterium]
MAKKADSSNNGALTQAVLAVVLQVPDSTERMGEHPAERAHAIARSAARAASVLSGSLSLPPGIFAWLTIVPELVGVWKLQAQMVSDIAAVYGQQKTLGREQMLYCLFKHVSAQLLRDVAVRVGERVVIQQTSVTTLQKIAQQIGVQVSKRVLSKSAARFVPLLGAVSVGAYAYFDTLQVAKNATELFDRTITIDENGR